jgi:hypothetical protein
MLFLPRTTKTALCIGIAACVLGVVLVKTASGTQAQTNQLEFRATEDATVKSGYSRRNYASAKDIIASNYSSNEHIAYLKFDLRNLSGQTVTSAELVVMPTLERTVTKRIMLVNPTSWQEKNITWQNKPPVGAQIGILGSTRATPGSPITIPIEVSAIQQYAGQTFSLAIANVNNSNNTLYMSSREGTNPPVLRVKTASGEGGGGGSFLPTDINGDGDTNLEDFNLIIGGFDSNTGNLDLNGNGKVDIFDTNRVITAMMQVAPPPSPTTTPAPTRTPTPTPSPTITAAPSPTPTLAPSPTPTSTPVPPPTEAISGIWMNQSEINALPTSGSAWDNLMDWAKQSASNPNISDQNNQTDAVVFAKALVSVRTGNSEYRNQVIAALEEIQRRPLPPNDVGILAVGRNLASYVVAADLVGYRTSGFENWLRQTRDAVFSGAGPSLSIVSCHEKRPNNFGTHCGTSRMVVDLYLRDTADFSKAVNVFHGWLGNRSAYTGFSFGDLDWQCNSSQPVGINPAGCAKDGRNLDGVLPDDQRRSGGFTWPPPKENYVWEALQGAVAQAWILHRQGHPAFEWQNQALKRAVAWLHTQANFPASGDDTGTPWIINKMYGTNFPTQKASPGKNGMGFYDLTHRR